MVTSLCLQALQEEVTSLRPQMDYAKDFTDSLITDTVDGTEGAAVTSDLNDLVGRYNNLRGEVDGMVTDIESGSQVVGQLQVSQTFRN